MQLRSIGFLWRCIQILLSFPTLRVNALRVHPPLIFVDEDHPVGTELPVAICGQQHNLRIRSGDEHNSFEIVKINNTCSTVKLRNALDADIDEETGRDFASYSLIFEAERQQASLDIQVVDINDNAPVFKSFPTNTPVLAEIGTVRVFDPDTGLGGLVEILVQGEKFSVDPAKCIKHYCTAVLRLAALLDYETQNRHSIVLVARDGARRIKKIHETRLPVFINVIDEEDMPPRFITDSKVKIGIPEDGLVGQKVAQIKAEDGDKYAAEKNQIRYDIGENNYFDIEHTTGWLILKTTLDRETLKTLSLNITATEQDDYKMCTEQTFSILVTDSDDEIPKCEKPLYIFRVTEGMSHFERSTAINVFDNDEEENAEFAALLSGKYSEAFSIEPRNITSKGTLTFKIVNASAIDYELNSKINLILELRPKMELSAVGSCSIAVEVLDKNDNRPQFNNVSTIVNVSENRDPHVIASFQAQELDSDQFLPIIYRISGPENEAFSVDENGRLSSRKRFDREKQSVYRLVLNATDNGGKGLTSLLNITVNIIDENDNPPQFAKSFYSVTVNEETESNFTVVAIDPDENENGEIKYSFLNNTFPNATIDSKTGVITFHKTDAEKLDKLLFNLTVIAEDSGNPSLESAVPLLLEIKDLNDHSPHFENSFVLIDVDQKSKGIIAIVRAKDDDKSAPNNYITYKLVEPNQLFSINERTGELKINEKPDGSIEFWKLTVVAEDGGNPKKSAEAKIFVQFKDREKVAFIVSESQINIFENTTADTIIFTPKLLNEPKSLTFEIDEMNVTWVEKPGKALNWLKINGTTGSVGLREQIDGDTVKQLQIVILIKNAEGRVLDKCKLTIIIDDVNDNSPVFEQKLYTAELMENSPIGKQIIVVEATDRDRSDKLSYSIISSKTNTSALQIDNKGKITVAGEIDFEKNEKITCTVVAEDTNGNADVANFTLTILDANDNRPIFSPSSEFNVSIYETASLGTLLNLSYPLATDIDSGSFGSISYSLTLGNDLFSIDNSTSQIFVNGKLDYEVQSNYTLEVRAVDNYNKPGASNEAFAKVIVNVLDVNDNAPTFVPAELPLIKLEESEQVGSIMTQLEATDKDSEPNNKITFLNSNNTKTFRVDSNGNLRLGESVKGKIGSKICTVVEARDSGVPPLSSFQKICLMVIPTGNTKYDHLFTINATTGRSDEEKDLRYGIIESYSQDWKSFMINGSGTVFAKQIFDFEKQKLYELRIQLCDFNDICVELIVFIAVNDLNDHCPEFKWEVSHPFMLELSY